MQPIAILILTRDVVAEAGPPLRIKFTDAFRQVALREPQVTPSASLREAATPRSLQAPR